MAIQDLLASNQKLFQLIFYLLNILMVDLWLPVSLTTWGATSVSITKYTRFPSLVFSNMIGRAGIDSLTNLRSFILICVNYSYLNLFPPLLIKFRFNDEIILSVSYRKRYTTEIHNKININRISLSKFQICNPLI